MTGVVLLCAEEDDLELVSWVHNARKHGITPEVVIGVERDDEPLIEALADVDARLFVVLRSENLEVTRIRELKSVFARHRRAGQELIALRLQPEEAEDAIVKIAAKIGRDLRPRTGSFSAIPLAERSGSMIPPSERSGATPRPVFNDATPVPAGTEPTGVFSSVDVEEDVEPPTIAWMPAAPPVAEALDWARRATELEITEPQARIDPAPILAAANERARAAKVRPASVAVLGTITAIVMLGAVVGGVLWMSATEWTSPIDGVPRSTVVAPADGEPVVGEDAPSEARIPSMPRAAEPNEPETSTKRPRSKPRAHESSHEHGSVGPFDTIEPPTSAVPSETPPSPVAEAQPAADAPKPDAVPTETASATTAAADSRTPPVSANEPAPTVAVTRPPA